MSQEDKKKKKMKERGRRVWICKGPETKELAWQLRGVKGKPSECLG